MAIINRNVRHNGQNFEKGMVIKKDHKLYELFTSKGWIGEEKKEEPKVAPDAKDDKKPTTTTKAPDAKDDDKNKIVW